MLLSTLDWLFIIAFFLISLFIGIVVARRSGKNAKNFFLSRERTFIRKFNEIFLAIQIEQALTKPEILEL